MNVESVADLNNTRDLLIYLKSLGRLDKDAPGDLFLSLLSHKSSQVRYWAVKNLGKLRNASHLKTLSEVAEKDISSTVRREAVSSIARLRSQSTIPILIGCLNDEDPKVVLQALRGLIPYKKAPNVAKQLEILRKHPNEMIQDVLQREDSNQEKVKNKNYCPTKSPVFMRDVVVHGDVRDVLRIVPDQSVHLTFTSPPYYNARDYSFYQSYQEYLDFLTSVFAEVHRVTHEGRFFILNTSPVIIPRVSRTHASRRYPIPFDIHPRLVDMGWEFVDDIVWAKPEASVKNRNAGFLQHRKPLGYKPNPVTEYLMVYRRNSPKLLDWNIRQYDHSVVEASKVDDGYETTNLWQIDPTHDRVHSAVFPLALCHRVIQYYSYRGDLIFDPFGGSGTLGRAARQLGRLFFMAEKEAEYVERMRQNLGVGGLFFENIYHFVTLKQFKEMVTNYE